MELTCQHCKHVWNYTGKQKHQTTCGVCSYKVRIPTTDVPVAVDPTTQTDDQLQKELDAKWATEQALQPTKRTTTTSVQVAHVPASLIGLRYSKFCGECGAPIKLGGAFCGDCGAKVV